MGKPQKNLGKWNLWNVQKVIGKMVPFGFVWKRMGVERDVCYCATIHNVLLKLFFFGLMMVDGDWGCIYWHSGVDK